MLKIISSAPSYDLTTIAQVKSELAIVDNEQDLQIGEYIKHASSMIVSYCNRQFAKEDLCEDLVSEKGVILLSRFPIKVIHSIKCGDLPIDEFAIKDVRAGIISIEDMGVNKNFTIEYSAGFVLPSFTTSVRDLPYIIERVCIDIVKFLMQNQAHNKQIISESIHNAYSVTYSSEISQFNQELVKLNEFRNLI